jgi:tetratricopeptide (TPR) repeat protein
VYLEQVRRIAPPGPLGLRDRDVELAELARFCLDPDGPSYAWWRADPWAGKSALLSTFVLRPSPEVARRVTIVSFFITARLAAQDTREAFIQVLAEQLAALLGQSLPTVLPEATREAYLLGLLSQAAAACQKAHGRLVLVVDGLDEDRGVTTGRHAHSIAGLLPASPPAGMRVIVASRPSPRVPDDVPDEHPLHAGAIVRPLLASPHARDVQRLARQELQSLLHGSLAERDVLGLLATARGGLTARDPADLADISLWDIEDILHTVAGRTFHRRPSLLDPQNHPEVYLLAHEELQVAAIDYLGGRIPMYCGRLHDWADSYRARRWPSGTPEYLLAGYFQLLDGAGDLPRMIKCALDTARHDRMLRLTGGDSAAVAEVCTALDRIAAHEDPDLASALSLACHRDHLVGRNADIPARLPVVWATLDHLARALALATSLGSSYSQADALTGIARMLARTGQGQQAETLARSIGDPDHQAEALAEVAGALAQAGQHQQAQATAGSITNSLWQANALAEVAGALAQAGQHQQATATATDAETIARSITTNLYAQAEALAKVAGALARAGQHQQATTTATDAEAAARSITNQEWQARTLAEVAEALAQGTLHQQAQAVACSITDPHWQATALAKVAGAMAWAGQHRQAEDLARSIIRPDSQATALAKVAEALAQAGQLQQAAAVAAAAEAAARSITNPDSQASILAVVAPAMAAAGQHQQARAISRCLPDDSLSRMNAVAGIARVLARAGQHEQAQAAARSFTVANWQANALTDVAEALAQTGQHQQAAATAAHAEAAARSTSNLGSQVPELAGIARALARAGQHQQAQAIARSIPDPYWRAHALVVLC